MSKRITSLFSILAGTLALGCSLETSGITADAMAGGGPALRFVTDHEVTRVFLPEEVHVELTGLSPGSLVTLKATMPGFASHATFRADDAGSVDVATEAPVEGTYEGADPDGLFWSMAPTSASAQASDATLDVTVRAEVSGKVVASATLERYAKSPDVIETEVHDHGLVAVFVTPKAPGPHPALLTFGGSEGGIAWGRKAARLYASLGYSCLGLAYFGAPGVPRHLEHIPLEYFGKALTWLKQRPEVNPDAIGVLGVSRGGELALLLGSTFPEIKAVVAQVPSGVRWPGGDPNVPGSETGAWTLGGHDLAWVQTTDQPPIYDTDAEGRTIELDDTMYDAAIEASSPADLDAATTRVEKVNGPVLMLASADDQLWPSCRLAKIAMDRLTKTGHAAAHDDELVCYPDAGHIVPTPGIPTTNIGYLPGDSQLLIALGGTPSGSARAARASFEKKKAFLAKALR